MVLSKERMNEISDNEKFVTLCLDCDDSKPKIGYTRKNANDKSITYNCKHYRGNGCKAKMRFLIDTLTGLLNPTPIHTGRHTRACIVKNGGDPDDFRLGRQAFF